MSATTDDPNNNNNDNNTTAITSAEQPQQEPPLDELRDSIKEEQQKEISYILETSQIDDKRSKYLAKQNQYKIIFDDNKEMTFKRKPLSSRKNKEIDDLRSAFISSQRSSSAAGSSSSITSILGGGGGNGQPIIVKGEIHIRNTLVGDGKEISYVVQQFLLDGYSSIT